MADHRAEPTATQTVFPWRTTIRSVFQFVVGLAASWALIVQAAGVNPGVEWVAGSVAIAAGITRVMALPAVDDLIRRFLPFLAPDKP